MHLATERWHLIFHISYFFQNSGLRWSRRKATRIRLDQESCISLWHENWMSHVDLERGSCPRPPQQYRAWVQSQCGQLCLSPRQQANRGDTVALNDDSADDVDEACCYTYMPSPAKVNAARKLPCLRLFSAYNFFSRLLRQTKVVRKLISPG